MRTLLRPTLIVLATALAAPAGGTTSPDPVSWEPQPVVAPVSPGELRAAAPWVPAGAVERSGWIPIGPDVGATLYLRALEVVRASTDGEALRFTRVPRARVPGDPTVAVQEQGIVAKPGIWYLAEPAGGGSLWLVTSERPTRVLLERPTRATAPPEAVREALVRWVEGRGELPHHSLGAELRAGLELERALGEALLRGVPRESALHRAVTSWRRAAALRRWALDEPLRAPVFRLETLSPPGEQAAPGFVRLGPADGEWAFEARGPALLELEGRAIVGQAPLRELELTGPHGLSTAIVLSAEHAALVRERVEAVPGAPVHRALGSGELLGPVEALRVWVPRGRHTYRLRWSGGPVVARVRRAERRPRLHEALTRTVSWEDDVRRAREALEGDSSSAAELLRYELAALDGANAGPSPARGESALPAELRARLELHRADHAREASERRAHLLEAAELLRGRQRLTSFGWATQLAAARRLIEAGDATPARELLRGPEFPESGVLAAQAAVIVANLPGTEGVRSRALAALELAWRKEPLSADIRRLYLASWYRLGRWSSISPSTVGGGGVPFARRWLDVQPNDEGSASLSSAHFPLAPGATVRFETPGPSNRPALLRGYVVNGANAKEPQALRIDDQRFELAPLAPVQPIEVALPGGSHQVSFEGAGATLYLGAPAWSGDPNTGELAYARTGWPIAQGGGAVRFRIPDPHLATPIRVQLRAVAPLKRPLTLWLHTDIGRARKLVLHPSPPTGRSMPLDGSEAPGVRPASVVLTLPQLTREVWLEPEHEQDAPSVVAAISVRRHDEAAKSAPTPTVDPERLAEDVASAPPLELRDRLLALSRTLREKTSPALHLERAELLVELDEEYAARADLVRVLDARGALGAKELERLEALLRAIDDERIERVAFREPLVRPMLLTPALPSLRRSGAASVIAEYFEARRRAARGELEDAALRLVRLYRDTRVPQLGLEALVLLERVQVDGDRREALSPLALGVSTELAQWAETRLVRRMRSRAARWTRWDRVIDAEQKAGTLELHARDADDLATGIEKALIAPPWSLDEVELVRAGMSSVLQLDEPEDPDPIAAEVACSDRTESPCRLALRIDGEIVARGIADPGQLTLLSGVLPGPGRHQVEVQLHADGGSAAVVRFVRLGPSGARTLEAAGRIGLLRARAGQPVVMTVLGPTTLRIAARAVAGGALSSPGVLWIRGEPVRDDRDGGCRAELPLSGERDPTVTTVGSYGLEREHLLLLPANVAYRVVMEPRSGEALIRVYAGVPDRGSRQASPRSDASTAVEPLRWPAMAPWISLPIGERASPVRASSGLGMFSAELGLRKEDADDGELFGRPLQTGLETRLAWRRELSEDAAWLRLDPLVRLPLGGSPVFGGEAALRLHRLPGSMRAELRGGLYTQRLEQTSRIGLRAHLGLERWFRIAPDWTLIPAVDLTLERFERGEGDAADERFDRRVFWQYGEEHPQRLTPRLTLRWQPFRDHLGRLSTFATSNADLGSLDQLGGRLQWSALVPLPVETRIGLLYEASWRLADAHRRDGYLRHSVGASLDLNLLTARSGRVVLAIEDRVIRWGEVTTQNVFGVGLRWDWSGGRGLRDIAPSEEPFLDLLDSSRSGE